MNTIGDKIRAIRKEKNLKQGELAKKLKMTSAQLCRIEGAKNAPSIKTLARIAKALGVSLSELMSDGMPAESEDPVPGAFVMLFFDYDGNGILDPNFGDYQIAYAVTDANGLYLFENLPPGPYLVDVYEDSLTTGGIRDVVPTTSDFIYYDLGAGEHYLDADFGYYRGARVEGNVFWDDNRNAWFEDSEIGLTNVTVTLTGTDMSGNPITRTTTTAPDGSFYFLVPEGDYTVTYDKSTLTDQYPSLGDETTPDSYSFHANPGEDGNRTSYDFGVDGRGAIGDTIFADLNGVPGQQTGEPGLADVTVRLYANPDGSQTLNGDETLLSVTVTDAEGKYLFLGLTDGNYLVEVATTTLPTGYATTPTTDPTGALDSQGSTTIVGSEDLTMDFGYPLIPASYEISGTIYEDNGTGGGTGGIEQGAVATHPHNKLGAFGAGFLGKAGGVASATGMVNAVAMACVKQQGFQPAPDLQGPSPSSGGIDDKDRLKGKQYSVSSPKV